MTRRIVNTQVVMQEHPDGWWVVDQKLFCGANHKGWDVREYEGATLVPVLPELTARGVALLKLAGNNYDMSEGSVVLSDVGRSGFGTPSPATELINRTCWVTRKYDPRRKV